MNFAHLHLLLNHIPVIGAMMGFALFVLSFFKGNGDLKRASLIVFAAIALLSIPTFLTGFGAQDMIEHAPGISAALIERHESSALLSIWFIEITGALALVGLWQISSRHTCGALERDRHPAVFAFDRGPHDKDWEHGW